MEQEEDNITIRQKGKKKENLKEEEDEGGRKGEKEEK